MKFSTTSRLLAVSAVAAVAALAGWTADADAIELGVNTRHDASLNEAVVALMKQRNLRNARVDYFDDGDDTEVRDFARAVRANGGQVQAVLQISYQWDHSCRPDLAGVEADAYGQTERAVHKVKDFVQDFELLNETQLRPEIQNEVPWNSAGAATVPYQGKPCVATLAAALRGMSRAISDIRSSSRLPLRIILGAVGRDFGFLSFMRGRGVQWDVTGFHVYPHQHSRSLLTDSWYGPGGPLVQLGAFGKPVHINEFNCGEIYDADYENLTGQAKTESCLQGLARHLKELMQHAPSFVEAVHLYELFDDSQKAVPENRFGLFHGVGRPKPHLALVTAMAGGVLSPQERIEVTRRGLLGDTDIDAARSRAVAAR